MKKSEDAKAKKPDDMPPQFDDVPKRMLDTKPQPKALAKPVEKKRD